VLLLRWVGPARSRKKKREHLREGRAAGSPVFCLAGARGKGEGRGGAQATTKGRGDARAKGWPCGGVRVARRERGLLGTQGGLFARRGADGKKGSSLRQDEEGETKQKNGTCNSRQGGRAPPGRRRENKLRNQGKENRLFFRKGGRVGVLLLLAACRGLGGGGKGGGGGGGGRGGERRFFAAGQKVLSKGGGVSVATRAGVGLRACVCVRGGMARVRREKREVGCPGCRWVVVVCVWAMRFVGWRGV